MQHPVWIDLTNNGLIDYLISLYTTQGANVHCLYWIVKSNYLSKILGASIKFCYIEIYAQCNEIGGNLCSQQENY